MNWFNPRERALEKGTDTMKLGGGVDPTQTGGLGTRLSVRKAPFTGLCEPLQRRVQAPGLPGVTEPAQTLETALASLERQQKAHTHQKGKK
jgi:hypothetical protein